MKVLQRAHRTLPRNMTTVPALYGLVLAGGASRRMGSDKATLQYGGKTQLDRAYELLASVCGRAFVSVRRDQQQEPARAQRPQVVDIHSDMGPIAGIAAAQASYPEVAWLVMACDLPFVTMAALERLISQREPQRIATAYRSTYDQLPEPLCAIWEPASRMLVDAWIAAGKQCPRKLLMNSAILLLDQAAQGTLDNVNTPDEYRAAKTAL